MERRHDYAAVRPTNWETKMNTHVIQFTGFSIEASSEWVDRTENDEPFTVGKQDLPVGALQFSVAVYHGGSPPLPSLSDLLNMAEEMGQLHSLGTPFDPLIQDGRQRIAGVSYKDDSYFIRIWFIS